MTTQNLSLFKALNAKLHFLDLRQRVLSQNVANADTPEYKAMDLKDVDFGRVLKDVTGDPSVRPDVTHERHMPALGQVETPKNREQKFVYEVAPVGNRVSLEEQMVKSSQNTMDYNLMTTLYQKNVGMIRTALGRGGF